MIILLLRKEKKTMLESENTNRTSGSKPFDNLHFYHSIKDKLIIFQVFIDLYVYCSNH
jgi:hypothetical protein